MLSPHEWAALLLSVLAGMGVGSGGLYLVFLTAVTSLPREDAIFCNLLFFIAAVLSSSVIHLRHGRLDLPFLLRILLFGLPGVLLGRFASSLLPPFLIQIFLGVFLVFSGFFSLVLAKKHKDGVSRS